jgi:hypothetical protein
MPNLDDFDLRPGDPGNPRRPRPRPRDDAWEPPPAEGPPLEDSAPRLLRHQDDDLPSRSRAVGIAVVLILALGLVVAFWLMSRRVEPPEPGTFAESRPEQSSPATADAPPRAAELEAPLPPLDQSDDLVRRLVGGLVDHPALAGWLANGGLLRTFAAAVENASLGQSPAPNLRFLAPSGAYPVLEAGDGGLVPDPAGYARYDLVTDVFTAAEPAAVAAVYRRVGGLVQEAFADLGYPDQSIDSALASAIELLVATPIPESPPALERAVNSYRYADPRLEELAPVQKQLLRMGPDNARRIRAQLRRIAAELELGID